MVVNSEKLLRLSFPGFGHVMILLIDVTAKDSNSIGLTSLRPKQHSAADFCLPDSSFVGTAPGGEAWLLPALQRRPAWQPQRYFSTALTQTWPPPQAALPSQPAPRWTRCSPHPGHHGSRGGTRPRAQHLMEVLECSKCDRASNSRSS